MPRAALDRWPPAALSFGGRKENTLPLELVKATPPGGISLLMVGTWEESLMEHLKAQDDIGIQWALTGADAVTTAHKLDYDVCLSSLIMGPVDGFSVMEALLRADGDAAIVISTHAMDTATVVKAMQMGAYDYVNEPHGDLGELTGILRRAAGLRTSLRRGASIRDRLPESTHFDDIVGASEPLLALCRDIRKVAPTPSPVLIEGPSGSGKELVAWAVHSQSPRSKLAFVAVNCAAMPGSLLESELFGHVKGAFTGADRDRMGVFSAADGGTLFLDEIAATTPEFQARLLRTIETGEVRPVGSEETVTCDVRIVAATNEPLDALVEEGRFRRDLYFRVNVMRLEVPPLSERPGDVELLAVHFMESLASASGKEIRGFAPDAMAALEMHDWPGNVRELRNYVERAVIFDTDGIISADDLPAVLAGPTSTDGDALGAYQGATLPEATERLQKAMITAALKEAGGNKAAAARMLGVHRTTVVKMMNRLGIT